MSAQFFGQFLLQRGVLSVHDLLRGLEYQRAHNLDLPNVAVREGLITREDLDIVRAEQMRTGATFSDIVRNKGFLTAEQIADLNVKKEQGRVLLGDALIAVGVIDEATRDRELTDFLEKTEQAQANFEEAKRALGWGADPAIARIVEATSWILFRVAHERSKVASIDQSAELPSRAFRIEAGLRGGWNGDYVLATSQEVAYRIASRVQSAPIESLSRDSVSDALAILVEAALWEACYALHDLGKSCEVSAPHPLPETVTRVAGGQQGWLVSLTLPDGAVEFVVAPR